MGRGGGFTHDTSMSEMSRRWAMMALTSGPRASAAERKGEGAATVATTGWAGLGREGRGRGRRRAGRRLPERVGPAGKEKGQSGRK